MKPAPIVPAEVDFSDPASPRSPLFDDRYHAAYGAFEQAAHVFLARQRPARALAGARRVHDPGDGLRPGQQLPGHLGRVARRPAALRSGCASSRSRSIRCAWTTCGARSPARSEPGARRAAVRRLAAADARPARCCRSTTAAWSCCWCWATPASGCASSWRASTRSTSTASRPTRNPQMWAPGIFKALSRLAAPGATAATWSAARAVRDGLQQAGFAWRAGRRHRRQAPHHARHLRAARAAAQAGGAHRRRARRGRVAIIGGGLAGAACAQALAREGLHCTVFDRHAQPAGAASGNVAGLFHGVFHPDDGMHARAHRAAALAAARAYARAIAAGVPGQRRRPACGWRPSTPTPAPLADALARSGLPADYVQAWSAAQVQAAGGPGVRGVVLSGRRLDRAGRAGALVAGAATASPGAAARASRASSGATTGWHLFDAVRRASSRRRTPSSSPTPATRRRCGRARPTRRATRSPPTPTGSRRSPPTRGQVSIVAAATPGLRAPALPIAGSGYALTLKDGAVMCGATTHADDPDADVRLADHAHNLRQLAAVTGTRLEVPAPEWVATADDDDAPGRRARRARPVARPRRLARDGRRPAAADRRGAGAAVATATPPCPTSRATGRACRACSSRRASARAGSRGRRWPAA